MNRPRCLEALNDVKMSVNQLEALIVNYRYKDARKELLLTTQDMINDLDDELTAARKEQEIFASKKK